MPLSRQNAFRLAIVLMAFVAAWPLLSEPGLLNTRGGGDSPFLLQRLHQLETAVLDGHFPVRWMPDANYGYGYPFFNYYAPLSIYIAAFFRLLGFSFVRAIQLAQLAGFGVAGWGMFALGKCWFKSDWAGLLAAAGYTVAPFHLVNVYVRGDSLAEFWAMAFYPLVILTAENFIHSLQTKADRRQKTAVFALAYAGLILSHNISAMIFSPFLLLFMGLKWLAQWRAGGEKRPLFAQLPLMLVALLFAFALSAWFFIPALADQDLAQLDTVTEGYFNYNTHFLATDDLPLLQDAFFFDYAVRGRRAFRMGLVQAGTAVISLLLLAWQSFNTKARRVEEGKERKEKNQRGGAEAQRKFVPNSANSVLSESSNTKAQRVEEGKARKEKKQRRGPEAQRKFVPNSANSMLSERINTEAQRVEEGKARKEKNQRRGAETQRKFVPNSANSVLSKSVTTKAQRENWLFIAATVVIATFMMVPLSRFLWDTLPLLSFTQFPWRFLSIQAFAIALALGAFAQLPKPNWVAPALIGLLFVSSLGQLKTDHLILTDADVTAEKLAQYEWFTGNIGTTVSAEYLPQTVQPRPYTSPWLNSGDRYQLIDLNDGVTAYENTQATTRKQVWEVETAVSTSIILPTLNWQGWQATLNGDPIVIQPAPGSGLIMLDLPAGNHTIELTLHRTPTQRTADLFSLIALITALFLLKLPIPNYQSPIPNPLTLSPPHLVTLSLLILAAILHLIPTAQRSTNNLTWDFAYMGYLHHDADGTIFEDDNILTTYTYSAEAVEAGAQFEVTLNWEDDAPATTVFLTTPAVNRPEFIPQAPTLTSGEVVLNGTVATATIAVPPNTPAGLYVPRLTVHEFRPKAPSGASRSTIHLRPILITNSQETAVSSPNSVQVTEVLQIEPELLRVSLMWQLAEPVAKNYNVSLRLTDANGNFLRLADRQPGYGYLPTSGWSANQPTHDWHLLDLPPLEEQHTTPYILVAQLYDVATSEPYLTRRLGELVPSAQGVMFTPTEPQFDLPEGLVEETAVFDNLIALEGVTLSQTDSELTISFVWRALANGQTDYTRFVHLLNLADSPQPIVQEDSFPRQNSFPTSQWTENEVVVDTVTLPIADLPAGSYQIGVGFYEVVNGAFVRLTAVDASGVPLPDDRVLIEVEK